MGSIPVLLSFSGISVRNPWLDCLSELSIQSARDYPLVGLVRVVELDGWVRDETGGKWENEKRAWICV